MRTASISTLIAALLVGAVVARAAEPDPKSPAPPTPPPPTASGSVVEAGDAGPVPSPTASASSAAPPQPPPPAAPPAAPPPSAAVPASARAPVVLPAPTSAKVHIAIDYEGAYLELRDFDRGEWSRACAAPCDQQVVVDAVEARVRAPGMTDSNTFRIDPGAGTARLKVSGGSAFARSIGLTALIAGVPIAFAGMGMFGYGKFQDNSGVETAGIVTLAVGGVLVLGSLPVLGAGRTSVRDARGKVIARRDEPPRF